MRPKAQGGVVPSFIPGSCVSGALLGLFLNNGKWHFFIPPRKVVKHVALQKTPRVSGGLSSPVASHTPSHQSCQPRPAFDVFHMDRIHRWRQ